METMKDFYKEMTEAGEHDMQDQWDAKATDVERTEVEQLKDHEYSRSELQRW